VFKDFVRGEELSMLVEFSIIPVGKAAGIGKDIAKVLEIVDSSGLPYKLNPMGTVVEGNWDDLMALIKKCHQAALRGGERVVTSIKIDDRKKHRNMIEEKVKSIEKRLHKPLKK
jgi:uncharacterized protein (TIGR00106 family)